MPSNTPVRFSGPLGWAIAGIAAGALFAAGALTARAFIDDTSDASQPPTQADTATDLPAITPNRPGLPTFGQGRATAEDKTTATTKPSYWGPSGCPVPLPSGTLGQSVIDLQGAGLTPRLPKDGFQLTSVNLYAFSDCAPDGTPTGTAQPVLSTSWRHTATGLDIQLTQSPTTEPVAPVLRPDGATFAEGSQAFTVSIYAFAVEPLDPRLPSPRGPHPRAGEVLREFIAQIVPGFDQQCFWTLADGDWNDLATYGVGDPRPAIPSEFTLQETHVAAFRPPAGPCDTTVKPTDGFGLYATWSADDGSSIGISVSGMPTTVGVTPAPGYIDQYSASWVNGPIQYNVWYSPGAKTPATTLVRDIARALDPAFDDACFVQTRTLAEADLRALGFRAPQPPAGYTIAASVLTSTDIPAGCQRPEGFFASYSLFWTLEKGADSIQVNIYSTPGATAGQGFSGWLSDYGLGWNTDDGTTYSIASSTKGISPTVPRDDLVAVAKSLYPELDITKLIEATSDGGPGGAVPPRPAPEKPAN